VAGVTPRAAGVRTGAPPVGLQWSVVIPAFNEAHRLPRYLAEVLGYFEARGLRFEVVVVDDGSSDGTLGVVQALAREHPALRALRFESNHGKGAAVRSGMLASSGGYRLFADADGATPIAEVERFEPLLAGGADIVIGSRATLDRSVSVVARRHRVAAGRIFNSLVTRLGLPNVSDSQCGFKAFAERAAQDLFARSRTTGFGFDVELLLLAKAAGYRIVEVPVNWTDQPGSKVGVLRDGPRMAWEIVRAWRRLGRG
jgi:dolichyl-phosphate beta-glucosyltransferase